jgi:hypothetical protein
MSTGFRGRGVVLATGEFRALDELTAGMLGVIGREDELHGRVEELHQNEMIACVVAEDDVGTLGLNHSLGRNARHRRDARHRATGHGGMTVMTAFRSAHDLGL